MVLLQWGHADDGLEDKDLGKHADDGGAASMGPRR